MLHSGCTRPNGRSHSGICTITLGRGAILSKSASQHIVTKSTCESELVTLSDSASLGMYLKNFMHEAGMGDAPGALFSWHPSYIGARDYAITLDSSNLISRVAWRVCCLSTFWVNLFTVFLTCFSLSLSLICLWFVL